MVHSNTVYLSNDHNVYSYELSEDKWTELPPSSHQYFSLAFINNKLTTIGGETSDGTCTNTLLSLAGSGSKKKWKELLPPMPTKRVSSAAVTSTTHLVVAGGFNTERRGLSTVEVLNTANFQWSMVSNLPEAVYYPGIILCNGYLCISSGSTVYSCSTDTLIQSSEKSSSIPNSSPWNRIADINDHSTIATLGEHILAVGGERDGVSSAVINCYDKDTNSWNIMAEMSTARSHVLIAVLSRNRMAVVGGKKGILDFFAKTEIGHFE